VDDLLVALGYGEVTCTQVINRLREENKQTPEKPKSLADTVIPTTKQYREIDANKYPIAGIEGLVYHIAGCCKPIPGENIIGAVTHSRGISIHHHNCPNLSQISGERLIPVGWNVGNGNSRNATYPVDIFIETLDRVGVLRDILGRLSDQNINVSNIDLKTDTNKPALITLTIDVQDFRQYEVVVDKIRNMSDVLTIRRVNEMS
jgi:GTP pyrophosphokinase